MKAMTAHLSGLGTARQQWAEAGIEVHLGRLTAANLHELGERLLLSRQELIERTREKIGRLKALADEWEQAGEDARDGERRADLKAAKLVLENDALRKRIAELEGKAA